MTKIREIKVDCKHKEGHLYAIDIIEGRFWGTLTGSDPDEVRVNRYCKQCRAQMGYVTLYDSLSTLEFTSPEFDMWFKEKNGE